MPGPSPARLSSPQGLRALLAGAAAALLAGCAVKAGPDFVPPQVEVPETFGPALASLAPPQPGARSGGWWRGFGDETLDRLVEQALPGNPDVAAAAARLAEARALLRSARSDRLPVLDARGSASADEVLARSGGGGGSGTGNGEAGGGTGSTTGSGSSGGGTAAAASVIFGWAPDLFGVRTRAVEAAQAEARRREALLRDLARTTTAELARSYVALRQAALRLALLDASLQLQERTLEIVRIRQEAGLASGLDVNRAAAEVATGRARRGVLVRELESARHALAVLAGLPPGRLDVALPARPSIPAFRGGPVAGTPRELLRRRADLAAAEANLARASAEIGVAQGRLYPSLSLPGSLTARVSGLGAGDVAGRVVAGVSAVIDLPLLDAGGRRAQVDAAEARAQEALWTYRATLLGALREAEDALVAIEGAQASRAELARAVEAGEQAFEQARVLYREGLAGFTEVLDAQRTLVASRDALAQAQAELARAIVDFHAAIGADAGGAPQVEPAG